jgi:hypothetical protein
MGAQALFVDVVGVIITALLLLTLRWAAIERGRIHREWTRLQHEAGRTIAQSLDWCVVIAATTGLA